MRKFIFILFLAGSIATQAQTNISAGAVSGTWQKSGSPYRVNGNIHVPSGQTLSITEGVKIEFQDTFKLDVYGKLSIKGKPNDTIVFTAKNTTKGWKGIKVFGQNKKDTVTVHFAKFEYFKTTSTNFTLGRLSSFAVDSLAGLVDVNGCRFTKSTSIQSGGGMRIFHSTLRLRNSLFDNNLAADYRLTNAIVSGASAAYLFKSNVNIDSITVEYNRSESPKYYRDTQLLGSGFNFLMTGCWGNLSNGIFRKNFASSDGSALYIGTTPKDNKNIVITQCKFTQNTTKNSGIVYVSLENSTSVLKVFFENCTFSENSVLGDWKNNRYVASRDIDFSNFQNVGSIFFKNCSFSKLNAISSFSCINSFITLDNCTFTHIPGNALFVAQGGQLTLRNCLIANNGGGVEMNQSTPQFYNCIIANNQASSDIKNVYDGSGFFSFFNGGPELFNCIVWGNKNIAGYMYNFFVDDGKKPLATNCIIEGSSDSIKFTDRATPGVPSTWVNVNPNSPEFVNPTAGAGIAYDALKADWHLKNTCNIVSPGFDAGMIGSGKYPIGFPTVDLDGNPRTVGGIMDIGPYEIQAPNKYTKITSEPKDTALCAGTQVAQLFKSSALGNSLSYQWQYSQDSSNWSNLSSQNQLYLNNYSTTRPGANYFRLIATNTACNKMDTTRKAVLFVNPNPKPFLGNDTSLANTASITLNPGSYASYQWTLPKGGNTTASTFTGNKTNLDTGKNTIVLRVVDSKGCSGNDTIKIKLEPAAGLQNPSSIGIKIYPVPASDFLHFDLPETITSGKYQLSSMDGRILQSGNLQSHSQINVSNLSTGTYFLILEIDGVVYGVKVVK